MSRSSSVGLAVVSRPEVAHAETSLIFEQIRDVTLHKES
jgi:hypothetical protein